MSITDILLLIGIIAFTILGIRDGFLKKIFGILGVLAGLVCATKFMSFLGDIINEWFGFSIETSIVIAFFVIFMFVVAVTNLLYRWFGRSGADAEKPISRIAGGILGALQGMLAMSLILIMFNLFDIPSFEERKESVLYDDMLTIAPKLFDMVTRFYPDSKLFFEEVKGKIENFKIP